MLEINRKFIDDFLSILADQPSLLFHIPEFRTGLAQSRLMEQQEVYECDAKSEYIQDHAVTHNMLGLANSEALWRPDLLYRPLASIEYIRMHMHEMKLLSIGPRSESELFSAYAVGFRPENVSALDILSYSPLVDLGDMHAMPYPNDSFDVVVAGWVLAYSSNNQQVADEIVRVAKPGAFIGIGCVAEPLHLMERAGVCGGSPVTSPDPERPGQTKTVSRFYELDQIHRLFRCHESVGGDLIDQVIFAESTDPRMLEQRTNLITIFRLR